MGARGRPLFVMVGRRWARGAARHGRGGQRYGAPGGLPLPPSAVLTLHTLLRRLENSQTLPVCASYAGDFSVYRASILSRWSENVPDLAGNPGDARAALLAAPL